jgi:hypothetical protein
MATGYWYIFGNPTTDSITPGGGGASLDILTDNSNLRLYTVDGSGASDSVATGDGFHFEQSFNTDDIYLDGSSTPSQIGTLPVGFEITSARIIITSTINRTGGTATARISNVSMDGLPFTDTTEDTFQDPSGINDPNKYHQFHFPEPFDENAFIGLNVLSFDWECLDGDVNTTGTLDYHKVGIFGSTTIQPFDDWGALDQLNLVCMYGTYTTTGWAFTFTEEEIAGVTFTRKIFQSFDPDTDDPEDFDLFTDIEPENVWWEFELETGGFIYVYQALTPGTGWTQVAAPENYGWWDSMQEAFLGNAAVVVDATPKRPRGFEQIAAFATGTASPFGGHPGPGVMLRQKLIYAGGSYTVGTDYPLVRVFDGLSDRELVRIPPTTSGGVPRAIMSMMTINGIIYLTTFDSGTTSADFAGRVFSLDLASAKLELIGAATTFASGEIPYCLAWHNGRLWCGTNQQDPSASGAIYWFRPGVDSVWTQDKVLSTEGQGGACSMISYGGKLFVGCSAAAGTAAEILARSPDGTWAVSDTGPSTGANNAFLAMTVWPIVQPSSYDTPHLFATYWNDGGDCGLDASRIRKFDGTTWTTSYTGSGDTIIPFIAIANINTIIYAVGGGYDRGVQLISSFDGDDWDVLTPFLPDAALETPTNIIVDMRQ